MAESGSALSLRLIAENKAKGAFRDVENDLDKLGRKIHDVSVIFGGLAVAVVTAFAVKAIKSASDVAEAQNKVNVVFGESAKQINDLAATSSRTLGQSTQAVLDAAGGFGSLFVSMGLTQSAAAGMSVSMVKLASDIASFNNISPAEALLKLRAGLVGEAEPLRQVGVLLNEAGVQAEAYASKIAKQGAELTEAQKVQARYNIILRQTNLQQGDFLATQNGLANSTRQINASYDNIAASMGKNLLPAIQLLTLVFKDWVFAFEDGSKILPETAIRVVTLIKLAFSNMRVGVLVTVLEMGRGVVQEFDNIRSAAGALFEMLSRKVGGLSNIPLIGAKAAGAAKALDALAGGFKRASDAAAEIDERIRLQVAGGVSEASRIVREGADEIAHLGDAAQDTGRAFDANFTPAVARAGGAAKEAEKSIAELLDTAMALDAAMPNIESIVAGGDLQTAAEQLAALGQSNSAAVGEVLRMQKEQASSAKRALEDAAKAAEDAARRVAEAWGQRSVQMGDAIAKALQGGKDATAGTAQFFKDEWVASLEERIADVSRKIRDRMRDGLDPSDILDAAQPLFDAYRKVFEKIEEIGAVAEANRKQQDERDQQERVRESEHMSADWIANMNEQGRQDWISRREAWERATFGASVAEMDLASKKAKAIQDQAWRDNAQRQADANERKRNAALQGVDEQMAKFTAMGWPEAMLDVLGALKRDGVNAFFDGKAITKQVGQTQGGNSSIMSAVGGF